MKRKVRISKTISPFLVHTLEHLTLKSSSSIPENDTFSNVLLLKSIPEKGLGILMRTRGSRFLMRTLLMMALMSDLSIKILRSPQEDPITE